MKRFFKFDNNDKGFSLVEVLVAMAVLAVISIPLIQTFVMSANINKNAKRLQNATDVGQDVAEYFTTIGMGELRNKYKDVDDLCGKYDVDPDTGIVIFQNVGSGNVDADGVPYYVGADGEKFYVTVVMDPAEYHDDSSSLEIKDINNYISPELGDLFSIDTVTAYTQFTKYDSRIKKAFKTSYPGVAEIQNIEYKDIKKTVDVFIEQEQNATNPSKIDYSYSITVKYTYCTVNGVDYVETPYSMSYHFVIADGVCDATGIIPDLYLLYTPFDTNDKDRTNLLARDEIIINYRTGSMEASWEKGVNVYIVQQDGGTYCAGVNRDNVKMKAYNEAITSAYTRYPTIAKLDIYSNITGWQKNVTAGSSNMLKLYEMKVYIWYGEPDTNSTTRYMDASFKEKSHYTVVSTVKEE